MIRPLVAPNRDVRWLAGWLVETARRRQGKALGPAAGLCPAAARREAGRQAFPKPSERERERERESTQTNESTSEGEGEVKGDRAAGGKCLCACV